jgi:hypothetical protein
MPAAPVWAGRSRLASDCMRLQLLLARAERPGLQRVMYALAPSHACEQVIACTCIMCRPGATWETRW